MDSGTNISFGNTFPISSSSTNGDCVRFACGHRNEMLPSTSTDCGLLMNILGSSSSVTESVQIKHATNRIDFPALLTVHPVSADEFNGKWRARPDERREESLHATAAACEMIIFCAIFPHQNRLGRGELVTQYPGPGASRLSIYQSILLLTQAVTSP